MSLQACLLSLLTARPMTGYELTKYFDASVEYLWHAPHSQIYSELRRMEEAGLVKATALPRGERATKRAYAITDAGRAEVSRWVAEPSDTPRPREVDYVKASYLEFTSFELAREQFIALRDRHDRDRREYEHHARVLEARKTELMKARLADAPPLEHAAIVAYKVHTYRGLAGRAAQQKAWAEEGIALVDRLEQAARAGDTPPSEQ
jgi:DNA-binding PadR family transcriptional regulator